MSGGLERDCNFKYPPYVPGPKDPRVEKVRMVNALTRCMRELDRYVGAEEIAKAHAELKRAVVALSKKGL